MDLPTLINRTNLLPILGVLGGIFRFYLIFEITFCTAASDLDLHCLFMSYKKDARLIWVNLSSI